MGLSSRQYAYFISAILTINKLKRFFNLFLIKITFRSLKLTKNFQEIHKKFQSEKSKIIELGFGKIFGAKFGGYMFLT